MLCGADGRESVRIGESAFLLFLCAVMLLYSACTQTDRVLSVPAITESQSLSASGGTAEPGDTAGSGSTAGQNKTTELEGVPVQAVIYVYVCGAVLEPKVVELPEGSRAEAALLAAGGFAENADREAVNLAALLSDGQKLYFPVAGEVLAEESRSREEGLVNINTADATGLCTLPGIGQSRAELIIAYRTQNGPFERIEDIMKVSGIKEGAFEKIKTQITVR